MVLSLEGAVRVFRFPHPYKAPSPVDFRRLRGGFPHPGKDAVIAVEAAFRPPDAGPRLPRGGAGSPEERSSSSEETSARPRRGHRRARRDPLARGEVIVDRRQSVVDRRKVRFARASVSPPTTSPSRARRGRRRSTIRSARGGGSVFERGGARLRDDDLSSIDDDLSSIGAAAPHASEHSPRADRGHVDRRERELRGAGRLLTDAPRSPLAPVLFRLPGVVPDRQLPHAAVGVVF
jgi:hypothetical protein